MKGLYTVFIMKTYKIFREKNGKKKKPNVNIALICLPQGVKLTKTTHIV